MKHNKCSVTPCLLKAFYFDSEFPFGYCEQFFIALCSIILVLLFSAMSNLLFNLVNWLHWMLQFSALKFDFFFCHFCMFYVSNWHFGHMYTVMITVKVFSADFYIVSLLVQFDWLIHSFISFLPVIFLPLCMTGILWLEPKCGQSSPCVALAILVFLRIFLSFMGGTFERLINCLIPLDLPFMIF